MTTESCIRVATVQEVEGKLRGPAAILLSASVPYERPLHSDPARNQHYLDSAEPARIRSAVIALTRSTLMRGARLVFGAHPSISPMVLAAARDVKAPKGSVLIFQSDYFESSLPDSTLELASWESGSLVLTRAAKPRKNQSEAERRMQSLALMRELMVSVPQLCASVFVGGMEGVSDEANLVRQRHPSLPQYALASTGSAARDLWTDNAKRFSGQSVSPELLASPSYSVVAQTILDELPLQERNAHVER